MLRLVLTIFVLLTLATVAILGFRGQTSEQPPLANWDDMVLQPKYQAQGRGPFFADDRAMRLPPVGTIAWGRDTGQPDQRFAQNDEADFKATQLPLPLSRELLLRGQAQFNTYCAVCHGASGNGKGLTPRYGMIEPPSYHSQRLREMPLGQIYQTITQGKGLMNAYGPLLDRHDRWAVVAYVKALQRAFDARPEDVPAGQRDSLK